MREEAFHEPDAKALSAMAREDKYVGEIGVGGSIGDRACESHLRCPVVQARTQGVRDRALEYGARHSGGPVRCAQDLVHRVEIEPGRVSGDFVFAAPILLAAVAHGCAGLSVQGELLELLERPD